jgi:hypothetical protein
MLMQMDYILLGPTLAEHMDEYRLLYTNALHEMTLGHYFLSGEDRSPQRAALCDWYNEHVSEAYTGFSDVSEFPSSILGEIDECFIKTLSTRMDYCGSRGPEWMMPFCEYRVRVMQICEQYGLEGDKLLRLYVILHGDLSLNTCPLPLLTASVPRALARALEKVELGIFHVSMPSRLGRVHHIDVACPPRIRFVPMSNPWFLRSHLRSPFITSTLPVLGSHTGSFIRWKWYWKQASLIRIKTI